MAISTETIRIGKKYRLINWGEKNDFEILEILINGDFRVKDLNSLEIYLMNDLVKYGKGIGCLYLRQNRMISL